MILNIYTYRSLLVFLLDVGYQLALLDHVIRVSVQLQEKKLYFLVLNANQHLFQLFLRDESRTVLVEVVEHLL